MGKWILRNPENPTEPLAMRENQWPVAYSDSFATFAAGGWGSRKTWSGLGFIDESSWINPGCDGLIGAPTYKLLRELINNKVKPAMQDAIIGESKQDEVIYLTGGRRIIYFTFHNPERLEMYTAAWAYLDEIALANQSIFTRTVARLRDSRATRLRLLVSGVPHWTPWLRDEFEGRDDGKRRILRLRTDDNTDLHPDAAQNLRESTSARMAPCHLEGQWVPPGGSVYPEVDEKRHAIPWVFSGSLSSCVALDWSPRTPHALFYQLLPEGFEIKKGIRLKKRNPAWQYAGVVFHREYFPNGIEQAITTEALWRGGNDQGYPITIALGDPAGMATEATSGLDQIFIAKKVLQVPKIVYTTNPRLRNIQNGIEHVHALLDPIDGPPAMYFSTDLLKEQRSRGCWNALHSYSYPDVKEGKGVDSNPVKDGISDHACDLIRYVAVNHFPILRLQTRVRQYA